MPLITSDEDPDELQDLESDANLTMEELRAKYNVGAAASDDEEDEYVPEDDEEAAPATGTFSLGTTTPF